MSIIQWMMDRLMWLTQHLAYHYVTAGYRSIVPCYLLLFLSLIQGCQMSM